MKHDEVRIWITTKLMEVSDGRLSAESVNSGTRLRQDLGLTSLLAVNLVLDVEDHFGVEVSDEELTRLGTVGNVVDLVMAKLSVKAQSA